MAVLINFKICDNAKECNGIAVCPTGALSWDEKAKTIKIDNSKCISCGACEKSCYVGAIRVAKTKEEYQKIKREIETDPRRVSDLFVDRYGAMPLDSTFQIIYGFETEVLGSSKTCVVELFNEESIHCLLKSIPIKELFKNKDIKYRKTEAKEDLLKQYKVKELPSLLFFKNGKLLGKIEGYYGNEQKKELIEKIDKIISKVQ